jgi:hypothetical protein
MPSWRMWNFCFSARPDLAVPLKRCSVDQDHRGATPGIGDLVVRIGFRKDDTRMHPTDGFPLPKGAGPWPKGQ